MALINLIYASTSVSPMSDDELIALLEQSREKNTRLGITGMLLYHDSNFLQVLEGEEEAVMALYQHIAKDPRHTNTQMIIKRPVAERNFGDWRMGFVNLSKIDPTDVTGYSDYLSTPLNSEAVTGDPSFAQAFLQTFKSSLHRYV